MKTKKILLLAERSQYTANIISSGGGVGVGGVLQSINWYFIQAKRQLAFGCSSGPWPYHRKSQGSYSSGRAGKNLEANTSDSFFRSSLGWRKSRRCKLVALTKPGEMVRYTFRTWEPKANSEDIVVVPSAAIWNERFSSSEDYPTWYITCF